MSKDTIFEFSKSIAWQIEPNKDFVYVLDNKNLIWYFFEDISKDIWVQVTLHKSLNNIIENLMKDYQVDYELIFNDVKNFIIELQEKGLVVQNG
jgi:hypothetical protein